MNELTIYNALFQVDSYAIILELVLANFLESQYDHQTIYNKIQPDSIGNIGQF